MTAKHSPATSLPWSFAPASDYTGSECNIDAHTRGYIAMSGQRGDETAESNSRYLVHAANAYPKLVEALRELVAPSSPNASDRARALLRELEEAE